MRLFSSVLIASASLVLVLAAISCDDDEKPAGTGETPRATDVVSSGATPTTGADEITITYADPGPTTFPVIAGKADGAIDVEMFMPDDIRIRAGDTIEWTAQGFEGHTITFGDHDDLLIGIGPYLLPDPDNPADIIFNPTIALRSENQGPVTDENTYINSGFIGVPAEAKYSLTFPEQGLYTYLCTVHPFTMRGSVFVDEPDAKVESPETMAARGKAELAEYQQAAREALARAEERARERAPAEDADPGVHRVTVGVTTPYGQVAAYVLPQLEIKAGDTVVFENDDRDFHNVIFKGDRPEFPPGVRIKVDPGGRGINYILAPESSTQADPPPEGFDDTTYLSSGSMGVLQPRLTWTLRFDNPGRYIYNCTIHTLAGMAGVITVTPR